MLAEIEVTEPFAVNGAIVAKLTVSPITLTGFAACIKEARRVPGDVSGEVGLLRARRKKQVSAFDKSGKSVQLDDTAFAQMPRGLFIRVTDLLDEQEAPAGMVIRAGDGIDNPVIFKLGVPLNFQGGESGGVIEELEFQARTGGDIESVVATNDGIERTIALITHCAAPLGRDVTLQRLPSWMLDQVSMADGVEIMRSVLPDFLS